MGPTSMILILKIRNFLAPYHWYGLLDHPQKGMEDGMGSSHNKE